jgi:hypothetical protein
VEGEERWPSRTVRGPELTVRRRLLPDGVYDRSENGVQHRFGDHDGLSETPELPRVREPLHLHAPNVALPGVALGHIRGARTRGSRQPEPILRLRPDRLELVG